MSAVGSRGCRTPAQRPYHKTTFGRSPRLLPLCLIRPIHRGRRERVLVFLLRTVLVVKSSRCGRQASLVSKVSPPADCLLENVLARGRRGGRPGTFTRLIELQCSTFACKIAQLTAARSGACHAKSSSRRGIFGMAGGLQAFSGDRTEPGVLSDKKTCHVVAAG